MPFSNRPKFFSDREKEMSGAKKNFMPLSFKLFPPEDEWRFSFSQWKSSFHTTVQIDFFIKQESNFRVSLSVMNKGLVILFFFLAIALFSPGQRINENQFVRYTRQDGLSHD